MPSSPDSENKDFLKLNAVHLFVPGNDEQIGVAIKTLVKAGLHPVRNHFGLVKTEFEDGQDVVVEGEFVAIAALGRETEVEEKAQKCMKDLGIVEANSQLLWATTSLIYYDIRP